MQFSDSPNWLLTLLGLSVREKWCTEINCTTCGAQQFRLALSENMQRLVGAGRVARALTPAQAKLLLSSLRDVPRPADPTHSHGWDEAMRLLLYDCWVALGGDAALPEMQAALSRSWSGEILLRMISHEQRRREASKMHTERNDPRVVAERRQAKKQKRREEHGKRLALQARRSRIWHQQHDSKPT